MEKKELNMDMVKASLTDMGISYREDSIPEHLFRLMETFGYEGFPLLVDLTDVDTVDAELGVIVRNKDIAVDNSVYIFTVLHTGQAGFIVVNPGTVSRASLVRKTTGDLISAITGMDLPPLTPFDMVEIMAHTLAGTFMKTIMESCQIPEDYEQIFLRLYMPKFLANVGMYFTGATNKDGLPMIYEQTVNMEPMIVWKSMQKGADTDGAVEGTNGREETGKEKSETTEEKEASNS